MWTKRRIARGIAFGLVLNLGLASIVAASQAGPGYLAVTDWSASSQNDNTVRLTATTNGDIPKAPDGFISDPDNKIVGFAWVDLDTGTALVATIHPVIGKDSNQRPGQWHLHTVQLGGGATAPNDLCLVAVLSTPTAGIQIKGGFVSIVLDAARMPDAGSGPIAASAIDGAAGFTVNADNGCGTGLGVRVRT